MFDEPIDECTQWDLFSLRGINKGTIRHEPCMRVVVSSDNVVGQCSRTMLCDNVVGQCCGTMLWDNVVGQC